jgi:hypothetical protein
MPPKKYPISENYVIIQNIITGEKHIVFLPNIPIQKTDNQIKPQSNTLNK